MSEQKMFEEMLVAMGSDDNELRQQAEASFEGCKSNPVWLVEALTEVSRTTEVPKVATMAFVHLRKLISAVPESYYDKCTNEVKAHVKATLLDIFGRTKSPEVRKAAASCVSALAVKLSSEGRNEWADLWPLLLETIAMDNSPAELRSSCCDILQQVATCLATTYLKNHIGDLARALSSCVSDPNPLLKKRAFEAVSAFVTVMNVEEQLPHFQVLCPVLLQSLADCLNSGDFETATQLCSSLSAMAETQPLLFAHQIPELLQGMMHVASTMSVHSETRHMAIEVMLSLCESNAKAVRRVHGFSRSLFELLFSYLMNPVVEDDWAVEPERDVETEGASDFDIGATGLDRLAGTLKGKILQQIATQVIMNNIDSEDWKARNAALTVITYIIEGCKKQFLEHLGNILQVVTPKLSDDNMVVRYSALQCIAQFCTDFGPLFQNDYHATVLPIIEGMLRDPVPKICALAAGALNNYFDTLDDGEEDDAVNAEKIRPYTQKLVTALVEAYTHSTILWIKLECLAAMSSLIECAKNYMVPYVHTLMPLFQEVMLMDEHGDQDIIMMKCRAVECTTLLACGVGKQEFLDYSRSVCDYLMSVLSQGLKSDDPRLRFILRGWTCMVECLQSEVLPYMDGVIPRLLEVANMDCDLQILPKEVGEEEEAEAADKDVKLVRLCIPGRGEKTVKIHTSLIEDKDLAITIIMSITDELKGHMGPYLDSVTNTCIPLLEFSAMSDIRETAAQTLAFAAVGYSQCRPDDVAAFLNHVCPHLIEAIQDETEVQVAQEMITSLGKIIAVAPQGAMNTENLKKLTEVVLEVIMESIKRKSDLAASKEGVEPEDEDDAEQIDIDDEDEEFLLDECSDLVGKLIRYTPAFRPVFMERFLPLVQRLLADEMGAAEKKLGLCLIDDFVEYAPAEALTQLNTITGAVIAFSQQPEATVFQAAVYGLGLVADVIGQNIPQPHQPSIDFATQATDLILTFMNASESVSDDYEDATCNAISSALKIIDHFATSVDAESLRSAVIAHLPGKGDEVEAKRVHEKLCKWLKEGHPAVADPAIRSQVLAKLRSAKEEFLEEATKQALSQL